MLCILTIGGDLYHELYKQTNTYLNHSNIHTSQINKEITTNVFYDYITFWLSQRKQLISSSCRVNNFFEMS